MKGNSNRTEKHVIPSPQPGSFGTKGKMVRKPSKPITYNVNSQVYGTTRLFGNKDLDAPREVPASQEKFVAGLMAELDHDSPDGITVAVGPFSTKGTFAVPISLAPKVDEFIQSDQPIIHVFAYKGSVINF
eukprot:5905129-Pleurochrysis_carterae.AAC.1